jgi:hypothetical protein
LRETKLQVLYFSQWNTNHQDSQPIVEFHALMVPFSKLGLEMVEVQPKPPGQKGYWPSLLAMASFQPSSTDSFRLRHLREGDYDDREGEHQAGNHGAPQ